MKPVLTATLAAALLGAAPAAADEAEVHTFHCLHGCPSGASATNDLIVREIYTLSSNDRTKFADWVAYRVIRETVGPSGGRSWRTDPWLAEPETLEPDDYDNAPEALSIDRGHQAPLAAFSGTAFAADTNLLSNITPQRSALNQASWQRLEAEERQFVERGDPAAPSPVLYVLTGPLYERPMPRMTMPGGYERHRVPSGYWKVLATEDGRMTAFILEQDTPRLGRPLQLPRHPGGGRGPRRPDVISAARRPRLPAAGRRTRLPGPLSRSQYAPSWPFDPQAFIAQLSDPQRLGWSRASDDRLTDAFHCASALGGAA